MKKLSIHGTSYFSVLQAITVVKTENIFKTKTTKHWNQQRMTYNCVISTLSSTLESSLAPWNPEPYVDNPTKKKEEKENI